MNSDTSASDGENAETDVEAEDDTGTDDFGDEVTEMAAKGRPSVFVLLTCGFLACMCCVGGGFTGGSLAWMRMVNMVAVLDDLGAPKGWKESSRGTPSPWSAEATVSGPADARAVTEWLADAGAKADEDVVGDCLSSRKLCTATLRTDGFPVTVKYGSGGEQAHATIHVD